MSRLKKTTLTLKQRLYFVMMHGMGIVSLGKVGVAIVRARLSQFGGKQFRLLQVVDHYLSEGHYNVISFFNFMLRQEVLNLYRTIFRDLRKVEDPTERRCMQDWARSDFRSNSSQTDEAAIKHLLQYGQKMLRELQSSLNRVK